MTKTDVERVLAHMEWADDHVREALAAADDPPPDAVELYAHVLGAELVWLDRIEQAAQGTAVWPDADLADCAKLAVTAKERYRAFIERLHPDRLSELVHYANSAGQEFDGRLGDILVHVALHGAYHRGQIAMLLRRAGAEPSPTDYIGFVRGAPAVRRPG